MPGSGTTSMTVPSEYRRLVSQCRPVVVTMASNRLPAPSAPFHWNNCNVCPSSDCSSAPAASDNSSVPPNCGLSPSPKLIVEPQSASLKSNCSRPVVANEQAVSMVMGRLWSRMRSCSAAEPSSCPAKFLSGTVRLKSNITLHLAPGCTLLGSTRIKDYPDIIPAIRSYTDNYVKQSLVYGENLSNISITGPGAIDGQGASFKIADRNRPYLIRLINCNNVSVTDLHLANSAMSVQHYLACQRLSLRNLTVISHANAIKMGTESNGGFRDITIKGVALPLFLRLGNRARPFKPDSPKPPVGSFKNVLISNIVATDVSPVGCSITGLPDHPIENVTLSNLRLTFEGGGDQSLVGKNVPEHPDQYPECTMFGQLPAYALYIRHAKNLNLDNIVLRTDKPEARPPVVTDDVLNLTTRLLDALNPP